MVAMIPITPTIIAKFIPTSTNHMIAPFNSLYDKKAFFALFKLKISFQKPDNLILAPSFFGMSFVETNWTIFLDTLFTK